MKRLLIVCGLVTVLGAAVAHATPTAHPWAAVWQALVLLQSEIVALAAKIHQSSSPHLYDAHGIDLGVILDSVPTLGPSDGRLRSFRVFDKQRRLFLVFADHGTVGTITTGVPGQMLFEEPNCAGTPFWSRQLPGEVFIFSDDTLDRVRVFAITSQLVGHKDFSSSAGEAFPQSCTNIASSQEDVFRTVELSLPYFDPAGSHQVAGPLSFK